MRQVTARIADPDYVLLRALAAALHTSQSEVLAQGLRALKKSLPPDVQRIVQALHRHNIRR